MYMNSFLVVSLVDVSEPLHPHSNCIMRTSSKQYLQSFISGTVSFNAAAEKAIKVWSASRDQRLVSSIFDIILSTKNTKYICTSLLSHF
jgi:hypothetical protein